MNDLRIAYFITPHGFGHAARAAAIMAALTERLPDCTFDVVTQAPEWFLRETVDNIRYHDIRCDLGLVQKDAMNEDPAATLMELDRMLPFADESVDRLAAELAGCRLVLTDTAALGILAATRAGIPAVLIENFRWDWIYAAYQQEYPGFSRHIEYLQTLYGQPDRHIQMIPWCTPGNPDFYSRPVSRKPRRSRGRMRREFGLRDEQRLVLLSMGGVPGTFPFLDALQQFSDVVFLIPGSAAFRERRGNLILAPQKSGWYHPDLIAAADAIICKAGYGTIAEAYHAGLPMGYMLRERFRESGPFGEWIPKHMPSHRILPEDWLSGAWLEQLSEILALPFVDRDEPNGADEIADDLMAYGRLT